MRADGLIHGAVQDHHERLEVGAFTAGTQPNPGLEAVRGHLLEPIDPEVHPHALKAILDRCADTGLPGSGRPVQDDDLARLAYRYHRPSLKLATVLLDEDQGQCCGGHQTC